MMMMVMVVVRGSAMSRTHSSMHLLSSSPSDEIDGMFNEAICKKSLQVFFDCLHTTRESDDKSISYCACNRSR